MTPYHAQRIATYRLRPGHRPRPVQPARLSDPARHRATDRQPAADAAGHRSGAPRARRAQPLQPGTAALGPAYRRGGKAADRLPAPVCQPAAGQPVERRRAPGRYRAGKGPHRSAVRQGRHAQPDRPVQAATVRAEARSGTAERAFPAAHRPHRPDRERPALRGPAPERAGRVRLRLTEPGADQPQHPARRQRRHADGRHRPARRAHRLAGPGQPFPHCLQRPAEDQRRPAQGRLALCARRRAAGTGRRRARPQHRVLAEPGQGHRAAAEPGQRHPCPVRHQEPGGQTPAAPGAPGSRRHQPGPGQAAGGDRHHPQPEAGDLGGPREGRPAGLAEAVRQP